MSISLGDRPLLVCPRPIRMASGGLVRAHPVRYVQSQADHQINLKVNDENSVDDPRVLSPLSTLDKDSISPRASPRCPSGPPSEALEEFLSILRPANFFPVTTSPILRTLHQGTANNLPQGYDRHPSTSPFSFRRGRLELIHPNHTQLPQSQTELPGGMTDSEPATPHSAKSETSPFPLETDNFTPRWFGTSNIHSSPISRNHTRNPFQRHASYDIPFSITPNNNSSAPSPLSPHAVPLPSPTVDEAEI